jgi:hypothetical protein
MTLKRRLERLEAQVDAKAGELNFVLISHYEAGDDEPHCKAGETFKVIVFSKPGCPSQVIERLPGETEAALLARAKEAGRGCSA